MADVILRDAYHFSEIARGCSKVEVFDGGGCAAFLSEVLSINPKQWEVALTMLQTWIPSCTEMMLTQFSVLAKELPEDATKLLRQKLTKATTENFTCEGLKMMKVLLHEAQLGRWRGLTLGSRASKLAFNLKERNAIWKPPNNRNVQVAVMSASDAVDLQTFKLILTDKAHAIRLLEACKSILVNLKKHLNSLVSAGTSAIAIAVVEEGVPTVEKSSVTAAKATETVAATAAAKVADKTVDKAASTAARAATASVAAAKAMEMAATAVAAIPQQRPPASTLINDMQLRQRLAQFQAEGWHAMDVGGGGDCFFRALAKQVSGNEQLHGLARHETIQYMRGHREEYEQTVEDFGLYVEHMSKEGTYIEGEIEIRAAASAFNIRIWVAGRSKDHDKMFAPLISNLETRDVYMAHFQAAQHYVVLHFQAAQHYVVLDPSPIARGGLPRSSSATGSNFSPWTDLPQLQRPSTPVAVFTNPELEGERAPALLEPKPASKIKRHHAVEGEPAPALLEPKPASKIVRHHAVDAGLQAEIVTADTDQSVSFDADHGVGEWEYETAAAKAHPAARCPPVTSACAMQSEQTESDRLRAAEGHGDHDSATKVVARRKCGTPGCMLPSSHLGLCQSEQTESDRLGCGPPADRPRLATATTFLSSIPFATTLQAADLQKGTRVAILWNEGLCNEAWFEGVISDVCMAAGHLIHYDSDGSIKWHNLVEDALFEMLKILPAQSGSPASTVEEQVQVEDEVVVLSGQQVRVVDEDEDEDEEQDEAVDEERVEKDLEGVGNIVTDWHVDAGDYNRDKANAQVAPGDRFTSIGAGFVVSVVAAVSPDLDVRRDIHGMRLTLLPASTDKSVLQRLRAAEPGLRKKAIGEMQKALSDPDAMSIMPAAYPPDDAPQASDVAMGDIPLTDFGHRIHAVLPGGLNAAHPSISATQRAEPSSQLVPQTLQRDDRSLLVVRKPHRTLSAEQMRALTFQGAVSFPAGDKTKRDESSRLRQHTNLPDQPQYQRTGQKHGGAKVAPGNISCSTFRALRCVLTHLHRRCAGELTAHPSCAVCLLTQVQWKARQDRGRSPPGTPSNCTMASAFLSKDWHAIHGKA